MDNDFATGVFYERFGSHMHIYNGRTNCEPCHWIVINTFKEFALVFRRQQQNHLATLKLHNNPCSRVKLTLILVSECKLDLSGMFVYFCDTYDTVTLL